MAKRKLYQIFASKVAACNNCIASGNKEWFDKHSADIKKLVADYMPSGSGIDQGTDIFLSQQWPERLRFETSFHHMDDHGSYDGWTNHAVIVTPSLLSGISIRITGRNRRGIKEYLCDVFYGALTQEVDQ